MSHDLSMADVRAMIRDMRREFNEKMDLLEARLRRRFTWNIKRSRNP